VPAYALAEACSDSILMYYTAREVVRAVGPQAARKMFFGPL